jgi:hypothetical protein
MLEEQGNRVGVLFHLDGYGNYRTRLSIEGYVYPHRIGLLIRGSS